MKAKHLQLDSKKMLGFRLIATNEAATQAKVGQKTASRLGSKVGSKLGLKPL